MIITEVEVLHLQIETEKPIQDATIPEPKSDKGTRAQIFVNIHTNEGISGLGISYPAPGVQHVIEKSLKQRKYCHQ